jgi:hypothetical protein
MFRHFQLYSTAKNITRKFFAKPYTCCMELHNILGCYISIYHPSVGPIEGYNQFFYENHFLIIGSLREEQNVSDVLSSVYSFDIKSPNIKIIKGEKKVYLPNKTFVSLDENSVFVYDCKKIKVY